MHAFLAVAAVEISVSTGFSSEKVVLTWLASSSIEKVCGLLHDVVEDSDLTFEDLQNAGFSDEVISVLRYLTKTTENEDYDNFINRVMQNPIAVKVKINDLLDNMDVSRLKELNEGDMMRLNKYLKAC